MDISGKQIIDAIARRLDEENIRCYDAAIVERLRNLSSGEIMQLIHLGDVTRWHNERLNAAEEVRHVK
jgi:hypothetical protein